MNCTSTDRERMYMLMTSVTVSELDRNVMEEMNEILDRSQREGASEDGSIDSETWAMCRDVCDAMYQTIDIAKHFIRREDWLIREKREEVAQLKAKAKIREENESRMKEIKERLTEIEKWVGVVKPIDETMELFLERSRLTYELYKLDLKSIGILHIGLSPSNVRPHVRDTKRQPWDSCGWHPDDEGHG